MGGIEFEVAGIRNINIVLPEQGNWYYKYLENGNIRIHGSIGNINTFSLEKYKQKIMINGGKIIKVKGI